MQHKNQTQFRERQIAESFTFPFAIKNHDLFQKTKQISLQLLQIKINKNKIFTTTMDDTQNLITIKIPDLNFSFNIYSNGKVRVWHDSNHEAIHYFLDFFYHQFITGCLVEVVQ